MSDQKKASVYDKAERFQVSMTDKTTDLFGDMKKYIESRENALRDQLTGNITWEKTLELRGSYAEIQKIKRNIMPKIRPTTAAEKELVAKPIID